MELPVRNRGDELLPPGAMTDIRRRLRRLSQQHDLATVIAYAFDHRTRILPFFYADKRMAPAGPRAIGSAMVDIGFTKTRIVLQQWNRKFRPSQMRLDGRIPDIFMVSSMYLHSAECNALIQDACRMEPRNRPLIIVGGPRMIYEPWDAFSADPDHQWGADVAVTGEEYVLLSLLEVILSTRSRNEPLRLAFERARDSGALDDIPGLVYPNTDKSGTIEELVDTGVQRLLGDLDELPSPVSGYELLEPPSRRANLGRDALPPNRIHRLSPISSIVMTFGCKFRCAYCPIPAYNQRKHRTKSGERIADEIEQLHRKYRLSIFFGTDDNFFNNRERTLEICETLARKVGEGSRPHCKIRFATEATISDTLKIREHLPTIKKAGLWGVWLGVEDITASLVNKGQNEDKTLEAFHILRENGILPMPMLMHHDEQPLLSRKGNYGLLNQLRLLRKAGAIYAQVLMLHPARGSKFFEDTYASGLAFDSVNGVKVEAFNNDGSYVVASRHPRPWIKQLNLLIGYSYFFNPIRMFFALFRSNSYIPLADAETSPAHEVARYSPWKKFQRSLKRKARAQFLDAAALTIGMVGLFRTYVHTLGWAWKLFRGPIQRHIRTPASRIPMRNVDGQAASHALPETTIALSPVILSADSRPAAGTTTRQDRCDDKLRRAA